jgi:glyoxylase-like metal-dependent hydrolase (beta-lactamase superfamily II)
MTLDGTNTWVIAEPGSAQAVVVDPGPDEPSHLRRVHDQVTAAGQSVARILLTHSHPDHAAGAAAFAAMTGAPVRAADPAYRLGDEGLAPGDVIGVAGCELRVVATPGHTSDSVSLHLPADHALLTGDTVLGRGTTVIAQDGNLADYLASLDRLRALTDQAGLTVLLPGHGPILASPALDAGDRTTAQIVARVYADVDRSLWPFAAWSVRAQLDYLKGQNRLPPGVSY